MRALIILGSSMRDGPRMARRKRGKAARQTQSALPGRGNASQAPRHNETYRKPLRLVRGGRRHGTITIAVLSLLIMAVLIVRALHFMR